MDNKLFLTILDQNNRLVIPGFGAFLNKLEDAGRVTVFTPYLKKDDQVLTTALASHFQVDIQDAELIVAEFAADIRQKLEESGQYYFDGLGTISLDTNGVITFLFGLKPRQAVAVVAEQPKPVFESSQDYEDRRQPAAVINQATTIQPQPLQQRQSEQIQPQSLQQRQPEPIQPQPLQQRQSEPIRPRPIQQQGSSSTQTVMNNRAPIPQPALRFQSTQARTQPTIPTQNQDSRQVVNNQRPVNSQQRRPVTNPSQRRPKPEATKSDIWLIVAIIAAALVVLLMIYGFLNSEPTISLEPTHSQVITTYTKTIL